MVVATALTPVALGAGFVHTEAQVGSLPTAGTKFTSKGFIMP